MCIRDRHTPAAGRAERHAYRPFAACAAGRPHRCRPPDAEHVVPPAPVLRRRCDAAHRTCPGRADEIARRTTCCCGGQASAFVGYPGGSRYATHGPGVVVVVGVRAHSLGSLHLPCTPPLYGRAPPLERPCPQQVHKIESRLPGQHIGELGLGLGPRGFECRRAVTQEPRATQSAALPQLRSPLAGAARPSQHRRLAHRLKVSKRPSPRAGPPGQSRSSYARGAAC